MNKEYKLIPFSEITDEARDIAVAWIENYSPSSILEIEQKHKLASDIMNYAKAHAKEFADWLDEMTTKKNVEYEKGKFITLYHYSPSGNEWADYTTDDIYLEFQEHLKNK